MNTDYDDCPGEGFIWLSICSMHFETRKDCNICMTGHWSNDQERMEDHKLYEEDYDAWFKKHNDPNSEHRQWLESMFPGLKGKPFKIVDK